MGDRIGLLGGTFDRLHAGHHQLIEEVAARCDYLEIHVTSDSMASEKDAQVLSYNQRVESLSTYIEQNGIQGSVHMLEDSFGPAPYREDCVVIGCTSETLAGCERINEMRLEATLDPLEIVVVAHFIDEAGEILSSSRIRDGLVSPSGKLWIHPSNFDTILQMPAVLDEELKQPLGTLHRGPEDNVSIALDSALSSVEDKSMIIAVGDVTVLALEESGIIPRIAVIDGRTKRQDWSPASRISLKESQRFYAVNPAGTLTQSMFEACQHAMDWNGPTVIDVEGEEDLSPIPLILLSPLGAVVMYGQPGEGLVVRRVDLAAKSRARRFLDAFQPMESK
ncbi:MAG: pantetheine-phosphate adenylyltransferase [Candidatus Thermoplasmatota archaeon]|nr:pantetheine-phosphate adenylyltransferase [Candidatus Thermoplasmatota archaeon]